MLIMFLLLKITCHLKKVLVMFPRKYGWKLNIVRALFFFSSNHGFIGIHCVDIGSLELLIISLKEIGTKKYTYCLSLHSFYLPLPCWSIKDTPKLIKM